jgi:hypothetical protein
MTDNHFSIFYYDDDDSARDKNQVLTQQQSAPLSAKQQKTLLSLHIPSK